MAELMENAPEDLLLLPLADAAAMALVSVDTFRGWVRREELPSMIIAGRRFVRRRDVVELLKRRSIS
jgi:hypothetical protein